MFTLSLRCYRAHGELKMVSNQHIVNTKNPEHTLAPICCGYTCSRLSGPRLDIKKSFHRDTGNFYMHNQIMNIHVRWQ